MAGVVLQLRSSLSLARLVRSIAAFAAGLLLLAGSPAVAQAAKVPASDESVLTTFYKDPRPERLVGFLERFGTGRDWSAYPPLVGFFAVIFRAHPDWIDQFVPARPAGKLADTIAAALQSSGQDRRAQSFRSRAGDIGADARLQAEFAGLPSNIADLRVATPTHLDILWGASFASGDPSYVRKIIDFFARTANRSEPVALDVAQTAVAISGGPKDIYGQLRAKYPDDATRREMVLAATALWALSSNARYHEFVDRTVIAYVQEHPESYATKALQAVRPKR